MKNVLVIGSGRSGTSMAAGMLAKAGYYMGPNLMPATPGNPKGYYESYDIENINETILKSAIPPKPKMFRTFFRNRPGKGQYWLTTLETDAVLRSDASIDEQISNLTDRRPYCYKDPRFCYTLPIWQPHLASDTVFVCVFRHPSETVNSMMREYQRESYLANYKVNHRLAFRVWRQMYTHVLHLHRRADNWMFFHYRQFFSESGQNRLSEFTGAIVDCDFPDKNLNRSRPQETVDDETNSIYHQLCHLAAY